MFYIIKKTLILVLLALFCLCGYAQVIDPSLLHEMSQRTNKDKIEVIVIMKSQYDREQLNRRAVHYATRAERREFVVNELQRFAEATQYDLRLTLYEMERQDMTTAPKIIWMANALYFSATKQAINDLALRSDIEIIGFDKKRYALFDEEPSPARITRGITSNVTQVNANQVWDKGYTGQGVVVAVIDTGVNYYHIDLADHLWDGGSEYPNHGYNFAYDNNDPLDDNGHGTHCAGTVCGDGTAGQQTGMAPDATLMCVKVLDNIGSSTAAITCNGMQWAVEHGCDLLSMSIGFSESTLTERVLFRNTCAAILDAGVVAAIGAGNNGNLIPVFPIPDNVCTPGNCPPPYMDSIQKDNLGDLSCSICVGAVNVNDEAAYFTSQGPVTWSDTEFGDYPYTEGSTTDFGLIRPDLCAPGVSIVSAACYDNSGYTTKSGTSMATPCVAGCISLMLSKDINITPAEICRILEETAVPLADGKSNIFGYGRVDALAAINAMYSGPLTLDSISVNDFEFGNNNGKLNAGETVALDLSLMNDSDMALDGATLSLSSLSEYVTITDGTVTLPHFDAGQTQTIENVFGFTLSNDAPGNTPILLAAETIINGESIGVVRIRILIYNYVLRLDEVAILNDDNSNGILEAGETADLHVAISNIGNDQATNIFGYLDTGFPYLTVGNLGGAFFGEIEANGQAAASFVVTLSNDAPERYIMDFSLNFEFSVLDFELVAGFIVFADPLVKPICVSLADTDDDGELSYEEAASVTDLYDYFQSNAAITSFDELQYFIGLSSIANYAFANCSRLKSIVLPNSITSIGEGAFYKCERLVGSLTIPNAVTTIGDMAFSGCSGLTGSLTIPDSVIVIGNSAFSGCRGFKGDLYISNSVTTIGDSAFSGCGGFNGNLSIPNSVTTIGASAFASCSGFKGSLSIPNFVTTIGDSAFSGCTGLTGSLTIGNSVVSIGAKAFLYCNGLTGDLIIPSSVTSIGAMAFQTCRNFSSITCLAELPPSLGNSVFGTWSSNQTVYVPCGSEDVYASMSWGGFGNYYGLCTVTQTIALAEGWNWFSTYIDAEDPIELLQMLEAVLGDNGLVIKSMDDYTTYEEGEWGAMGDLDDEGIVNEQMYAIQVSADCAVQLQGLLASPGAHAITIYPGWNWIGFPIDHAMSIEDALSDYEPEDGDVIKEMEDYSSYANGWGDMGDLEELTPGHGYKYYSNSTVPKILVFSADAKKVVILSGKRKE